MLVLVQIKERGNKGGRSVPSTSTPTPYTDTPETLIPTQYISLNEGEIEGEGEGNVKESKGEGEGNMKEIHWKCVKCGEEFSFARSGINIQLGRGSPGFYAVCPKCDAHNRISWMEKYPEAKKELELIFPKEERDSIIAKEMEKKRAKKMHKKKKEKKKTTKEEEIFMRDEIPEAIESGYEYEEPTITYAGKEYSEPGLVETWGIKGMNTIKKKRLAEGLKFIKDASLREGIMYRFSTSDEMKNNPRFLFDTILGWVGRLCQKFKGMEEIEIISLLYIFIYTQSFFTLST